MLHPEPLQVHLELLQMHQELSQAHRERLHQYPRKVEVNPEHQFLAASNHVDLQLVVLQQRQKVVAQLK
jgi:hypothetical protein